jgi:hypothetical protein
MKQKIVECRGASILKLDRAAWRDEGERATRKNADGNGVSASSGGHAFPSREGSDAVQRQMSY